MREEEEKEQKGEEKKQKGEEKEEVEGEVSNAEEEEDLGSPWNRIIKDPRKKNMRPWSMLKRGKILHFSSVIKLNLLLLNK